MERHKEVFIGMHRRTGEDVLCVGWAGGLVGCLGRIGVVWACLDSSSRAWICLSGLWAASAYAGSSLWMGAGV